MKYVPLFDGILESTLWDESLDVRTLYFTMLLLMDADFVVRLDFEKVARKARLRENRREGYHAALEALKVLVSPDRQTLSEQDEEGIRVIEQDDGYFVVSGQKYQDLMAEVNSARRRRKAQQERRRREKEALMHGQPLPGETTAVAAMERGDEETSDAIAAERRPTNSPATLSRPSEKSSNASVRSPVRALEPPVPARITVPPTAAPQHRTLAEHQALRAAARGPQGVSHDQPPKLEQANQHVAPGIQPVAGPSTVSPTPRRAPSSNNSPSPSETPPTPSAGRRVQSTPSHDSVPPRQPASVVSPSKSSPSSSPSQPQPIPGVRSAAQVLPGALRQLPRRAVPPNALSGGWEERTVQTGQASSPKPSPAALPEPAEEDLPEDAPFE